MLMPIRLVAQQRVKKKSKATHGFWRTVLLSICCHASTGAESHTRYEDAGRAFAGTHCANTASVAAAELYLFCMPRVPQCQGLVTRGSCKLVISLRGNDTVSILLHMTSCRLEENLLHHAHALDSQ